MHHRLSPFYVCFLALSFFLVFSHSTKASSPNYSPAYLNKPYAAPYVLKKNRSPPPNAVFRTAVINGASRKYHQSHHQLLNLDELFSIQPSQPAPPPRPSLSSTQKPALVSNNRITWNPPEVSKAFVPWGRNQPKSTIIGVESKSSGINGLVQPNLDQNTVNFVNAYIQRYYPKEIPSFAAYTDDILWFGYHNHLTFKKSNEKYATDKQVTPQKIFNEALDAYFSRNL